MSSEKLSRRHFLRLSAATGVGLAVVACAPAPGAAPAGNAPAEGAASGPYQGKFVIISAGNPEQNDPLIKAIEEAHPGVEVEWRGPPPRWRATRSTSWISTARICAATPWAAS
jgi:ABC-type glycerol-3-phosphate transport system substrate-binding protein